MNIQQFSNATTARHVYGNPTKQQAFNGVLDSVNQLLAPGKTSVSSEDINKAFTDVLQPQSVMTRTIGHSRHTIPACRELANTMMTKAMKMKDPSVTKSVLTALKDIHHGKTGNPSLGALRSHLFNTDASLELLIANIKTADEKIIASEQEVTKIKAEYQNLKQRYQDCLQPSSFDFNAANRLKSEIAHFQVEHAKALGLDKAPATVPSSTSVSAPVEVSPSGEPSVSRSSTPDTSVSRSSTPDTSVSRSSTPDTEDDDTAGGDHDVQPTTSESRGRSLDRSVAYDMWAEGVFDGSLAGKDSKQSRTPSPVLDMAGGSSKYPTQPLRRYEIDSSSDRKEARSPVKENIALFEKGTHKPLTPQPGSFRRNSFTAVKPTHESSRRRSRSHGDLVSIKPLGRPYRPVAAARSSQLEISLTPAVSRGKDEAPFSRQGAFFRPLETTVNPVSSVDVSMIDSSGSTEARGNSPQGDVSQVLTPRPNTPSEPDEDVTLAPATMDTPGA
jgi:hypothetical protein